MNQVMMGDPIVVRCGSCATLLRVALRPGAPGPAPPPPMDSAFMNQLRMQAAAAAQHQQKLRMMAMYGQQMGHHMMMPGPSTPHNMGQPPRPEAMYLPSPLSPFGRGFGGMMPPMMGASPGAGMGHVHHPGWAMYPPQGGGLSGVGSPDVQRMKVQREPSKYNLHMREEIQRLKSDQPSLEHREAWKMASGSVRALVWCWMPLYQLR
jgi:hypothetical protein